MDRPREKSSMGNLLKESFSPVGRNIGLVFCRTSRDFFSPFILDKIVAMRLFSALCETTYVAPLYLHNEILDEWKPNLDIDTISLMTEKMCFKPDAIMIFDYVYGILYDPIYNERFNEFLKRDFPRVPKINNESDKNNPEAFYVSEDMFNLKRVSNYESYT